MNKKAIGIVVVILLIILCIWAINNNKEAAPTETIKIGVILPMTGPAAVYGETFKNGMEMARADLAAKGVTMEVIYEDSAGDSKAGVTAYNKLVSIDKVDAVVAGLSRVVGPLLPLAEKDKMPLIVSLVAASDMAKGEYVMRLFPEAEQLTTAHFSTLEKLDTKKIAVLYVNDEFGNSMNEQIKAMAASKGITITASESFLVDASDFRSSLAKIKASNPEALLYVANGTPTLLNVVRQSHELGLTIKFFEAGANLLTLENLRKDLGPSLVEGKYTSVFPSFFAPSAQKFNQDYKAQFGKDPLMSSSPYGYEIIDLIGQATAGKAVSGLGLIEAITKVGTLNSVNGQTPIKADGEINSPVASAQIVNGQIMLVK